MNQGIYRIVHVESGRCYIGSSSNIHARWLCHRSRLRLGQHHSPKLLNLWRKHGEEAFRFEVIEEVCDRAELESREQHYLDTLKPWCNVNIYANSPKGTTRPHSLSTRQKISQTRLSRGIRHTPEVLARIAASKRGKPVSAETKAKMSETHKAKGGHTAEHIAGIQESQSQRVARAIERAGFAEPMMSLRDAANLMGMTVAGCRQVLETAGIPLYRVDGQSLAVSRTAVESCWQQRQAEGRWGARQLKWWLLIAPTGERRVVKSIHSFCKQHGLQDSKMNLVAEGKRSHHHGWKCYRCDEHGNTSVDSPPAE